MPTRGCDAMHAHWAAVALAFCLLSPHLWAREIVVSPQGSKQGHGTEAAPLDIATALGAGSPAKPGNVIVMAGGIYEGKVDPKRKHRLPLHFAISGTKDQPIRIEPRPGAAVHIRAPVEITGAHAHYVGLEIGDPAWSPQGGSAIPKYVVRVRKSRAIKLINCNIFGGSGGGVIAGVEAIDLELYGCLIHDVGTIRTSTVPMDIGDITAVTSGSGDAFASKNREGTKVLKHNVLYRACGANTAMSTYTVGYEFIENISFLSKGYKPNESMDSLSIGGNYQSGQPLPVDRIRVIGNVAYQPKDASRWRPNLRVISFKPAIVGRQAIVQDNYLMGAFIGANFTPFERLTFSGNTVWATGILVNLDDNASGKGASRHKLRGYQLRDNTYFRNRADKPFRVGHFAQFGDADGKHFDWQAWQALGLDQGSELRAGPRPTGVRVFVFRNAYEKGRAHVAVFHWKPTATVEVDLSGVLAPGTPFRILNLLEIMSTLDKAKPVVSDTWRGGKFSLPLRQNPTCPDFEAFLVLAQVAAEN